MGRLVPVTIRCCDSLLFVPFRRLPPLVLTTSSIIHAVIHGGGEFENGRFGYAFIHSEAPVHRQGRKKRTKRNSPPALTRKEITSRQFYRRTFCRRRRRFPLPSTTTIPLSYLRRSQLAVS